MSLYRIKRARTVAELAAVKRLDSECFVRDTEPLKLESSAAWIAVHTPTGAVIGYALARVVANESVLYLARVGVDEKHRGHGLQKRFIRVRQKYARQRGCVQCITYTVSWNPKSINSLLGCGFKYYLPDKAWAGREMLYWYTEKEKRS